MKSVTSYLFAIVLSGIFAAVSELILPSRLFSVGRLMRAVCAALIVMLFVSPVLSFLSGAEIKDVEAFQTAQEDESEDEHIAGPQEAITALALSELEEQVSQSVSEILGEKGRVEVFGEDGLNKISARIYCDSQTALAMQAAAEVEAQYGIDCCVENEENG